jgi:MFS family permease
MGRTAAAASERRLGGQAFRALRHRNYRWYWLSGLAMTGAQGLQQFALPWLVLDLTGSVGRFGLVAFIQGVTVTLTSLYGGVLADRYDRRNLLIACESVSMLNLGVLALLTLSGLIEIWHIYVSAFFLGVTMAVLLPTRNALVRGLVEREDLMNAVALNSMQQHSSRIIWPTFAGVLITVFGVGATLGAGSLSALLGVSLLFMVRGLRQEAVERRTSATTELMEGMRYIAATPPVRMVMTLTLGVGTFGLAYMFMAPAFAREVMGFSAGEAGLFVMASGVGAILGSTSLVLIEVENRSRFFVFTCFGFGLSILAIALNPWFIPAFLFMAAFGVSNATLAVTGQSIFQILVPQHLLGRVVGLWSLSAGLGYMAALPIGVIGDAVGLRWPVGGAAAILVLMTLWFGVIRSPLRRGDVATSGGAGEGQAGVAALATPPDRS